MTKEQERSIAYKMQTWIEYNIIETASNFITIGFEDDEQSQVFKIYSDGKTVYQW